MIKQTYKYLCMLLICVATLFTLTLNRVQAADLGTTLIYNSAGARSFTYTNTGGYKSVMVFGFAGDGNGSISVSSSTATTTLVRQQAVGGWTTQQGYAWLVKNLSTNDKITFNSPSNSGSCKMYGMNSAYVEATYLWGWGPGSVNSDIDVGHTTTKAWDAVFQNWMFGEADERPRDNMDRIYWGSSVYHIFYHTNHEGFSYQEHMTTFAKNVASGTALNSYLDNKAWSDYDENGNKIYELNNHSLFMIGVNVTTIPLSGTLNVSVNTSGVASWNAITGAANYTVKIGGNVITTTTSTSYDLKSSLLSSAGSKTVTIVANPGAGYTGTITGNSGVNIYTLTQIDSSGTYTTYHIGGSTVTLRTPSGKKGYTFQYWQKAN